ncbi:hypothetical protein ABPG74_016528 [Tetrahymena malaccensis]
MILDFQNLTNTQIFILALGFIFVVLLLLSFYIKTRANKKFRNLSNQVVIVTGSNTGIGFETAKDCALNGAKVILACRDQQRTQPALESINKLCPNSAEFIRLDLGDLSSVRLFVNEFKSKYNKLDLLINNAAIVLPQRNLTKDGFETQIGTNHFGHFLLTNLLMDKLKASPQFRVINVSSLAHSFSTIDFDDLHFEKRPYRQFEAYAQSKIANVLFTISLQKRIDQQKLNGISVSLHPGTVRTEISRNQNPLFRVLYTLVYPLFYLFSKSPSQGAQTTLYCIHEDFDKLQKGAYYSDCKKQDFGNKCITQENAEKLWDLSTKLVKI